MGLDYDNSKLDDLLPALRRRDDDAWNELISVMTPQIDRMLSKRIKNPQDREDIAQNSLEYAYFEIDGFEDGSISSWIFSLAEIRGLRHLYNDPHENDKLSLDEMGEWEEEGYGLYDGGIDDIETRISNRELVNRISEFVTDEEYELLYMRAVLEMKWGEIAEEMGLEVGAVKKRYKRLCKHLQLKLR